jgi:hypothetical protein
VPKTLIIASALVIASCSATTPSATTPSASTPAHVDPDIVGTWFATTGDPPGVTAVYNEDGSFTWSWGDLSGTYEADGSVLTAFYPDDSHFCPGGTITWEYEVTDDTLTADVIGGLCQGTFPFEQGPPSPDWIFERQ